MNNKRIIITINSKPPPTLFIVELEKYVLITSCPIEHCVFPTYRFDDQPCEAYEALDAIAISAKKFVINGVGYKGRQPHIYDPNAVKTEQAKLKEINA